MRCSLNLSTTISELLKFCFKIDKIQYQYVLYQNINARVCDCVCVNRYDVSGVRLLQYAFQILLGSFARCSLLNVHSIKLQNQEVCVVSAVCTIFFLFDVFLFDLFLPTDDSYAGA